MELEVGKYYRTRDGRKAKVIKDDGAKDWPCLVDYVDDKYLELWCSRDGVTNINAWKDDLIAEWTDAPEVGTLKEIGAQVGDVVTISNTEEYAFRIESVSGYRAYGKALYGGREYDEDWSVVATNKWRIVSRANQATTGPVRTVTTTRKEIVPGVYGRVEVGKLVGDEKHCSVGIMQDWHVCGSGDEKGLAILSAEELTAAIATLTEIRDALAE